jgi:two-component system, OmpR family, response regulator
MIETPAGATKVLVVDDEPSITDMVSMALRYEEFDVRVAGSGREALDTVETFAPDLAVLDIMMPGIDGLEVARRLRNQGVQLPILFLSARDATEDRVRALTLGDDYVTKPFSVEELVARIRAVLRRVQWAGES